MNTNFLAGKTILVVDDEQFSRQIVARHLKDYGNPDLLLARNGAEALNFLSDPAKRCDAAILDFVMPGVNGLTVLKAIRTGFNGIRRDLPVLMLSGNSDAELVSSAMLLDVNALAVKPVSKNTLASRLARMLGEPPKVRPEGDYSHIPTEDTERRSQAAARSEEEKGQIASVGAVTPGAVLARDLCNSAGTVVLPAGIRLTERYLVHLRELAALDSALGQVWVM